ncbi:MAG: CRISPR-associated protein Cas4, partial [Acidobacteriota bacterium]|nr:CRISPR-associated protein Cas4 [Acidobacteriota bacterium]
MNELTKFTGTEVGYYFICRKKLWWFAHGIQMEQESDRVKLGKVVHEKSYERKKKEISIDNKIVLDWQADGVIHEVKLTDSMEEAHEFQLLYYIYYLKQKGVEGLTGQIDYPKLRQTKEIELTFEREVELEKALREMEKIVLMDAPPEVEFMKICK